MATMLESISKSLIRDDGSITVVFAVTLLVILTAAGIGSDYSNAHRAHTLLQTKVDAAVLAGASVENVTEDGKSVAIKFLDNAFESENMSDSVISRVVTIDPDTGDVSATVRARINTYLLQVVGQRHHEPDCNGLCSPRKADPCARHFHVHRCHRFHAIRD